jgi:hypothetical protein
MLITKHGNVLINYILLRVILEIQFECGHNQKIPLPRLSAARLRRLDEEAHIVIFERDPYNFFRQLRSALLYRRFHSGPLNGNLGVLPGRIGRLYGFENFSAKRLQSQELDRRIQDLSNEHTSQSLSPLPIQQVRIKKSPQQWVCMSQLLL